MAPVTRESFRDRLSALSPDAFAAFVAALWRARGRELRRTGQRIVAARPGTEGEEVLYALPPDGDLDPVPAGEVDVLVVARTDAGGREPGNELPGDVRVIDADELRRIARYAIDREAAVGLLADHLGYDAPSFPARDAPGRPTSADAPGGTGNGDGRRRNRRSATAADVPDTDRGAEAVESGSGTGGSTDEWHTVDRRSALVGGALLAGLAAAGLRSSGVGGLASLLGARDAADGIAGDSSDQADGSSTPFEGRFVPGVTSEGEIEPRELADAHAWRLRDTSYTLSAERTVRGVDGSLRSSLAVDVALAADRTYVARVETAGSHAPRFLGIPPARATFWSDGETYVRRFSRGNQTTFNEFEPPDNHAGSWRYWVNTVPFGGREGSARAFVSGLFGNVRTEFAGRTTADGEGVYRFATEGARPDAGTFPFADDVEAVDDVSVDALVDGEGLVRSLDLSYAGEHLGAPARVERTVRYRDVGHTVVDRPAWYARAVGSGTSAAES